MTANEFESLNESKKKIALFEAKKLAEKIDEFQKTELFQIDNFYIESRTSRTSRTNRVLKILLPGQFNELYINSLNGFAL